jgi:CHAD domain-containing protein
MKGTGKRLKGSRQFCTFGASVLGRLYAAFTQQFEGVRTAADPEHIHDMRVASRRLRATLPIFRGCFPAQEYRTWLREIRRITRALGVARDKDVQIEFLKSRIAACTDPALLPGLEYLLLGLTKERRDAQPAVVKAIDRVQESAALRALGGVLEGGDLIPARGGKALRAPTVYAKARDDIRERLDALFVLETSLDDPEAIEGHHAMRIAAKWLRYTMEVYAPLYDGALDEGIAAIKQAQEILGSIHDLDVWILHLPQVLDEDRTTLLPVDPDTTFFSATGPGIRGLLDDCRTERDQLFEEFTGIWAEHHGTGFFQRLTVLLDAEQHCALDKRTRKAIPRATAARIQAVIDIGRGYRFEEEHSLHVTRLALSLYDQLAPLHRLCAQERYWLQCAGILHDIGYASGRKDHPQRSRELILADQDLPFRRKERSIIGLVARYHGYDLPGAEDEEFRTLSEGDQRRVLALAALLRVADALDVSHEGRISGIGAHIEDTVVVIACEGNVPAEEEQAAVAKKGNLFEQAFERSLEIAWSPEPLATG